MRVVREGDAVDPATWTRRARTGAIVVDDAVDAPRVLGAFADGATIVLQSLQRWWPPVAAFCRELETTLTHAIQANAYLTPAGAVGLAPHHDTHDVFVMQLHGTKHWTLREPVVEAPLRRHRTDAARAREQPVLFETELRPGSCLYIPRGVVHSARAQEGVSLHLTVGVLATTAHDVIQRLVTLAGDVPALRRSLPPGWAHDTDLAADAVEAVLAELASFAAQVDPTAVAADLTTGFSTARQPLLAGHLVDLARVDALDDTSVVRCRDGVVWTARRDGDRYRVRVADRTVDLPASIESVVRDLLDGSTTCVGDLTGVLDPASRLVLVRRLVREGLLRIVESDAETGAATEAGRDG